MLYDLRREKHQGCMQFPTGKCQKPVTINHYYNEYTITQMRSILWKIPTTGVNFGLEVIPSQSVIDRVALAAVNQFFRHPKRTRNATTLVKRISRENFMSLPLSITIANVHGKNTNGSHRFELEKNTFLDVILM